MPLAEVKEFPPEPEDGGEVLLIGVLQLRLDRVVVFGAEVVESHDL